MGWLKKKIGEIKRKEGIPQPEHPNDIEKFKTGTICEDAGDYLFYSYLDGSDEPLPLEEERVISLDKGGKFPLINSINRTCYWIKPLLLLS